jgi:hypothetical protein
MRSAQVSGEATRGAMDRSLRRMLYAMSVMTVFIVIQYDCLLFLPHPNDLQNYLPSNRIRGWVGWQD